MEKSSSNPYYALNMAPYKLMNLIVYCIHIRAVGKEECDSTQQSILSYIQSLAQPEIKKGGRLNCFVIIKAYANRKVLI